jgi:hypothetical protein
MTRRRTTHLTLQLQPVEPNRRIAVVPPDSYGPLGRLGHLCILLRKKGHGPACAQSFANALLRGHRYTYLHSSCRPNDVHTKGSFSVYSPTSRGVANSAAVNFISPPKRWTARPRRRRVLASSTSSFRMSRCALLTFTCLGRPPPVGVFPSISRVGRSDGHTSA